jgi:hypothetical protein
MAKTSPRNATFAFSTWSEFANEPDWTESPAVSSAPRDAGITPSLETIAITFKSPPNATSQRKGSERRFTSTHTPTSA